MTIKQDLPIRRGSTFSFVVQWMAEPLLYKAITAINQAAPVKVTAAGHGIPDQWPTAVICVKGMTQLNALNEPPGKNDYHPATYVDADNIEFNGISSACFKAYTSGGYLQFYTPKDLAGYAARLSIMNKRHATKANLWTATTAYATGDYTVIADGTILMAETGGTSDSTEPTEAGTDGTVEWVAVTDYTGAIELMRFTTVNGRITLDNTTKQITLNLTAAETEAITWSRGVYDLEMVASDVTALMEGNVTVNDEITT